jgi:hypothetical protein
LSTYKAYRLWVGLVKRKGELQRLVEPANRQKQ